MIRDKRFVAFFIDSFISGITGLVAFVLSAFIIGVFLRNGNLTTVDNYILVIIYSVVVFIFMVCRDLFFRNASIGKNLMHLEVKTVNNQIPSKFSLIMRNILYIIWPLDVITILFFDKKIEDYFIKTEVVACSYIKPIKSFKRKVKVTLSKKTRLLKWAAILLYLFHIVWLFGLANYKNDDVWFIESIILFIAAIVVMIWYFANKRKDKFILKL